MCWEAADVLTTRIAEIAKVASGFTFRFAEITGNSSLRTKELRSFDAV